MKTIKLDPPAALMVVLMAVMLCFGFVGVTSAATVTDVTFEDDESSIKVAPNATIDAELRIVVPSGEEVEFVETDFDNDNRSPKCVDLNKRLLEGTHYVDVSIKAPKDRATFDLDVDTFGLAGVANAGDCSGSFQNGSDSFNNVVRVSGDADEDVGNDGELSSLLAQVKALAEIVKNLTSGGSSTGKCPALNAKLVGTMDNTYNDANVKLQGYLLSEGASIPALKAGASFGYKGAQTNAAVSWFKSTNGCVN